jgi:hypothetical protein
MDFRDFDDPLLYADPDYGEELYATWGGLDLSVPTLEDDDKGAWVDEGAPFKLVPPELASVDTLRRVRYAQEVSAQHDAMRHELKRNVDFEWSFSLNNLFYPDEPGSSSPAPSAKRVHRFSRDELVAIVANSHSYLHLLDEADVWVHSVPVDALPVKDREIWQQLAGSLVASTRQLSGPLPVRAGHPHLSGGCQLLSSRPLKRGPLSPTRALSSPPMTEAPQLGHGTQPCHFWRVELCAPVVTPQTGFG